MGVVVPLYGVGVLEGLGPLALWLLLLDEGDGGLYVFFTLFYGVATCIDALAVGGIGSEAVVACADVDD